MNNGKEVSPSTKARTLEYLLSIDVSFNLCKQKIISYDEWLNNSKNTLNEVIKYFDNKKLAVRSSSIHEDNSHRSNAGAFLTLLNIEPNLETLSIAINKVFDSYESKINQEVLVQEMISDVALSGVMFTRDLNTGAPYYTISYDDFSGLTDTVTSGKVNKMLIIRKSKTELIKSDRIKKIINSAKNLEDIFNSTALDIEFCVNQNEEVFILQVRPLAAKNNWLMLEDDDVEQSIEKSKLEFSKNSNPKKSIFGKHTIFGDMPDWNPAEIIGVNPKPLALSLYKYLITDQTWSAARSDMGYKDVKYPLMIDLCGHPFIDVRNSLNSFLPEKVNENFAAKLIDFQIDKLSKNPNFHDKIEFEIAITCIDLLFDEKKSELLSNNFDVDEIERFKMQLQELTNNCLKNGKTQIENYLKVTESLYNSDQIKIDEGNITYAKDILNRTINFGTKPFSILARHAFIAVSVLKSLLSKKIITEDTYNNFFESISTITSDFVEDLNSINKNKKKREEFFNKYGHLRPGTYDILSPRYDEDPNFYLNSEFESFNKDKKLENISFKLSKKISKNIDSSLLNQGININTEELIKYFTSAVPSREKAKLAFSKGISDTLLLLKNWGIKNNLSLDEISHLEIKKIFEHNSDLKKLKKLSDQNKKISFINRAIHFPNLIRSNNDLDVILFPEGSPTFISSKTIVAKLVRISKIKTQKLDNCIVYIEGADPGFDWIFTKNIAGLITKYGGANSHMAIRCAEFSLPAAIGCGEKIIKKIESSQVIELNCKAKTIKSVREA